MLWRFYTQIHSQKVNTPLFDILTYLNTSIYTNFTYKENPPQLPLRLFTPTLRRGRRKERLLAGSRISNPI